jgi:hypothetical protein
VLCLLPSMYFWVMEVINLVGRRCMTQSRGGSAWPSKTKKAFLWETETRSELIFVFFVFWFCFCCCKYLAYRWWWWWCCLIDFFFFALLNLHESEFSPYTLYLSITLI